MGRRRGAGGTAGSGCAEQARQGFSGGTWGRPRRSRSGGRSRWVMPARKRGHSSDSQRTAEGRGMPAELLSL